MKRILCYGDSNTWGYDARDAGRFPPEVRWTGRLQTLLGPEYTVVECGFNGRTTAYDDGYDGWSCGSRYLPVALKSHDPLDLVVVMLGTNDLKARLGLTMDDILKGVGRLVHMVRSPGMWTMRSAPQVLVAAPMMLNGATLAGHPFGEIFSGRSVELSARMGEAYRKLCAGLDCPFLDASMLGAVNSLDGVHMSAEDHQRFAELMAEKIRSIL